MGRESTTPSYPRITCGQCTQEVVTKDGRNVVGHRCEHGYTCNGRSSACPHCYRARLMRKPTEA